MSHHTRIRMTWDGVACREYPLPAGYEVRRYFPADKERWIALWRLGGLCETENDETEYKSAVTDVAPLGFVPERDTLLICDTCGTPVATISAFLHTDEKDQGTGHIHMVSADPSVRGRGIGNAMMSLAMKQLVDNGCRRMFLLSDDFRLAAVKSYLNQGFKPDLSGEGAEEKWQKIYQALGLSYP